MKLITAVPFLVFAAATSVSVAGAEFEDRRLKTKPSSSSKGKVCTAACANAKLVLYEHLFRFARNFPSACSALIHCNPFISLYRRARRAKVPLPKQRAASFLTTSPTSRLFFKIYSRSSTRELNREKAMRRFPTWPRLVPRGLPR